MLDAQPLGRIGVLMGGSSSEREISLKSGKAVYHALEVAGCDVVAVDITTTVDTEIVAQIRKAGIDVVFNVLHGKFGEDGTIQSILENEGIAYTGCGPQASKLAMDKIATQTLLKQKGIQVPDFRVFHKSEIAHAAAVLESLGGCPVVVKPSGEGSSIGITIVMRNDDFLTAINTAFEFGSQILIEKYIRGRELTSGILGEQALPLVEIRPKNDFFDFTAKYQKGMSDYIVPAPLSPDQAKQIQEMSLKAFQILGCRDMARSDFILEASGQAYFLEINTIPGFTATSLLPMAAQSLGLSFTDLCLRIARFALLRVKSSAKNVS